MYDLGEPQSRTGSPQDFSGGFPQFQDQDEEGKAEVKQGLDNQDGLKVLPFEFVALEACLEAACSCLENEVSIFFLVQWVILSLLLLFCSVLFIISYFFIICVSKSGKDIGAGGSSSLRQADFKD